MRRVAARSLLRLVQALGLLLLLAAALLASVAFHAQLPIARRVATQWITVLASDAMRGALSIGSIERIASDGVVARHVTLFDPQGRPVIRARELLLVPDLEALLRRGELRIERAQLRGGRVLLVDDGEGLPTFISAFESPRPSLPPEAPTTDDAVVIDGIELQDVRVQGELLGLSGLHAVELRARGQIRIGDDVRIRVDDGSTTLIEPFGFEARVDRIAGTISTYTSEGVDLSARARRGDEEVLARVRYRSSSDAADSPQELSLSLQAQHVQPDTLRAVGFTWLPPIVTPLSGTLELGGPIEELALWSELTTPAGPATVQGSLSETAGFAVTVKSDALRLDAAFEGAPAITLAGSVRVEAAPEEEEPRFHAELEPLVYDAFAIPALTFEGRLAQQGIEIERLTSHRQAGRISARGRVLDDGALQLRIRYAVTDLSRDPNLRRLLPDARGALQADVTITTPQLGLGRINFSGRITLNNFSYGSLYARRLSIRGSARGDLERPALDLSLNGEQVAFAGYDLGGAHFAVSGGPRRYKANGQFTSDGQRTFNLDARILAGEREIVIEADPIEMVIGQGSWRGALLGLRYRPQQSVALELLRLASQTQRLEARGIVRFQGEDQLEAQLQDFDLAALHAIVGEAFPLREGRTDSHVQLFGDLDDPKLLVQGALRGGRWEEIADIDALYFINYEQGALELDGEVQLGDRGTLDARGFGRLDRRLAPTEALRRGHYDLEIGSREGLDLRLFPALAEAGWAGRVGGRLAFKGTLTAPTFDGLVELSPLEPPGWSPMVVSADSSYEHGRFEARVSLGDERGPLALTRVRAQVDWSLLLREPERFAQRVLEGPLALSGNLLERRLDHLPEPLRSQLPFPLTLEGSFEFRRDAGKSSGDAEFSARWVGDHLDQVRCGGAIEPRMGGRLTLNDGVTEIQLSASDGPSRLRVDSTLATPIDRWLDQGRLQAPTDLTLRVRANVREIARLPYLCEYGTGSLQVYLGVDGGATPRLKSELRAAVQPHVLSSARGATQSRACTDKPLRVQVEANTQRGVLAASGALSGCGGGDARFTGKLPIAWNELGVWPSLLRNEPVSGRIDFDATQLKPLLERIPGVMEAAARARGAVKLSGSLEQPQLMGSLLLDRGEVVLQSTGQRFEELGARLTWRGDWAKVDKLEAKSEGGTLTMSGGVGFDGLLPRNAQLAFNMRKLPLAREGLTLSTLTGSGAIDVDLHPSALRLQVKLHSMTIVLPDRETRVLQPLDPHPDVVVVTETAAPAEEIYPIEVMIDGTRQLEVRRSDFNAQLSAELALRFADPELFAGGYVEFEEGEFQVFGKRFVISRGRLRFDGSAELNPEVTLVAVHQPDLAGAATVTASVGGTLERPEVNLTSDACPGDTGAITYLISGRCLSDDPEAAEESAGAQQAFTAGVLSGVLTLGARGGLGGLVPRLAIESRDQGRQARVAAGFTTDSLIPAFMRPLVQRVYLQGAVSTGPEGPQEGVEAVDANTSLDFLIELYFPHSIVGAGRFGQNNWGLDVIWEP